MSESPMVAWHITLERCPSTLSGQPMWRYTLRNESGTAMDTWETGSGLFSLPLLRLLSDVDGLSSILVVGYGETPNAQGEGT
jgi:hypothetical protein